MTGLRPEATVTVTTWRIRLRRWWPIALVLVAAAVGVDAAAAAMVEVAGPHLVAVRPGTPLANKLDVRTVAAERISSPLLTVTGSIVARLAPGSDNAEARWDFSQLDLATTYADWLRARAEEPYTEQQLAKTRQLVAARSAAQAQLVDRLRRLVKAGTDSPRDLAKAEADLVEAQLEGQKQLFEAEAAFKNAARSRATLERQLFQAGVDPGLLARAKEGAAIMVAEVPETHIGLVRDGQLVTARLFALPSETVTGHVSSLAPTLASDRRTLRVFVELDDPQSHLRPGMFADIGLGMEPRDALSVPSDAVLHVGRSDYVLVQNQPGVWRVNEVRIGEARGNSVEVLSGLAPGDTVVGSGAILLKPLVVQSLQD
jgi:cobalt-zinc-cadmium efflux system membrane fusion protein